MKYSSDTASCSTSEKSNGSQNHLPQFLPGRCISVICDGRETTQSGLLPCWASINLTGMAVGLYLLPLDDKGLVANSVTLKLRHYPGPFILDDCFETTVLHGSA